MIIGEIRAIAVSGVKLHILPESSVTIMTVTLGRLCGNDTGNLTMDLEINNNRVDVVFIYQYTKH